MRLAKLKNSPFIYFNYTAWISWITLILIVLKNNGIPNPMKLADVGSSCTTPWSWTRDKSWSMLQRLTEEFAPLPTISDEMVLVHWTHSRRTKTAGAPKYGTWSSVMARWVYFSKLQRIKSAAWIMLLWNSFKVAYIWQALEYIHWQRRKGFKDVQKHLELHRIQVTIPQKNTSFPENCLGASESTPQLSFFS